jgi:hypothetical protein
VYFRPWTAYNVDDIVQATDIVATMDDMHQTKAWGHEWGGFVYGGDTYPLYPFI